MVYSYFLHDMALLTYFFPVENQFTRKYRIIKSLVYRELIHNLEMMDGDVSLSKC